METKISRKSISVLTGAILINFISLILARYMFLYGKVREDRILLGMALCIIPSVLTVKSMSFYCISEFCVEERNVFGHPVMRVHINEISAICRYEQCIYFFKEDIKDFGHEHTIKIPYNDRLWEELVNLFPLKICTGI